ncbi:N-acetylmuramoyl-L-alanine amidase [Pseudogemmobacter humi]|uniref:N-acetylmuramoyl-L-alanine amidase n=1 Tax=Pseudogemmobacter humi TaxID=2483812 RepID=A0A3P5XE40_9RHOB|nr:N-acetylmuramoyl-L-alanine amidase [Pseudogemmobacter humi]VDC33051.1 N-acetylmuramoyl-L-alanine amidase AmiC precursor [Pseudogemmobacter humi]
MWQFRVVLAVILGLFLHGPARAEGLSALARLDPAASSVSAGESAVTLDLAISQPVPWRVRMLDDPPRMILDAREVEWTGLNRLAPGGPVRDLRAGVFRAGWSRLVIVLDGPWMITRSEMRTGDETRISIRLERSSEQHFARLAGQPEPLEWSLPPAADLPAPVPRGQGPVVVVIDPGHGGIDPGAERDGHREADLMLAFARELKELLLRDGRFSVVLTREEDVFVPLETRISVARAAGAHVFLSLHADALAEGEAHGATLYTLSDEATDAAAAALAERHERDDLLAGIDLSAQDDLVATVLMDMARTETKPRTDRLALALETAIKAAELRMHRKPRQEGGFSVLKSPDIPSVLLELGFLSSSRDLKRLTDPDWRARMAAALRDGLVAWADEDLAIRALRD